MKVTYIAHPVGADTQDGVIANLLRAKRWYHWLCESYPERAFCANWIVDCEIYAATNADVGPRRDENAKRKLGLLRDDAVIAVCDEYLMCGGWVSSGMGRGLVVAKAAHLDIVDLSGIGTEPPDDGIINLNDYVVP